MKSDVRLSLSERHSHSIHETACDHEWLWQITEPVVSSLRRFMAMALMGAAIGYSGVVIAEGFLPDKQEILMMPQLCQWMYGARAGMNPALIPQGPSMDVSGCTRFHYYCDAHTDLVRAEKSAYNNPGRAKEKLARAIEILKGQVQFHNAEPCSKSLRADISYTLGKALGRYARLTKSSIYYAEAISPLLQTIELTPEDVRSYQMLGDVYVALNKPEQAEEAIYIGLQNNPESKSLLRRYKEIGGKRPLPTGKPATTVEAGKAESTEPQDIGKESDKTLEAPPASVSGTPKLPQGNPAAESAVQHVETQAGPDRSKDSRYCRFCVDEDSDQNKSPPASDQTGAENPGPEKPACRFCP